MANKKNFHLDVVEINNFLDIPFSWKWDGVEYTLKSGERGQYPRFIANQAIKHMVDYQIIHELDRHKDINDPNLRSEWEEKAYIMVKEEVKEPVKEEVPVEKLKRPALVRMAGELGIKSPMNYKNIELIEEIKKSQVEE